MYKNYVERNPELICARIKRRSERDKAAIARRLFACSICKQEFLRGKSRRKICPDCHMHGNLSDMTIAAAVKSMSKHPQIIRLLTDKGPS